MKEKRKRKKETKQKKDRKEQGGAGAIVKGLELSDFVVDLS